MGSDHAAEICSALRAASAAGTPLRPVGADSRAFYGNPVDLPALSIALIEWVALMPLLRNDMIMTLQEDFIAMARAKGLPAWRILFRHALRPSRGDPDLRTNPKHSSVGRWMAQHPVPIRYPHICPV